MFESRERLKEDIGRLLEAIREMGEGRYACLVAASGLVLESRAEGDKGGDAFGRVLADRVSNILSLPTEMSAEGPGQDVFREWPGDGFLVVVLNGRVALVVACPAPDGLRDAMDRPVRVLADRLLRYEPTWRMDSRGRGFFFGRPRMDVVVIEPAGSGPTDAREGNDPR